MKYRHSDYRPLPCPHCNKKFKVENDLNKHLLTHSEEDPYQCNYPECGFSCRSIPGLKYHIRKIHLKQTLTHACHICDSKYTCGKTLTSHLIKVHDFQWPPGHVRFK